MWSGGRGYLLRLASLRNREMVASARCPCTEGPAALWLRPCSAQSREDALLGIKLVSQAASMPLT